MSRGLLIVDVQRDFCEGGALGVDGGNAVAANVAQLLMDRPGLYTHIFASLDWHDAPPSDNGGHFALDGEPDFVSSWPVHCVAYTVGSELHPVLMGTLGQLAPAGHLTYLRKGQGRPDYSAFQGRTVNEEWPLSFALGAAEVSSLDVVGIATDHCVFASALDATNLGKLREVRVVSDLCAGVDEAVSTERLVDLRHAGAQVLTRRYL